MTAELLDGRAIAKTVEIEIRQSCTNRTRFKRTCTLSGIGIKNRLSIAGVRGLARRE